MINIICEMYKPNRTYYVVDDRHFAMTRCFPINLINYKRTFYNGLSIRTDYPILYLL